MNCPKCNKVLEFLHANVDEEVLYTFNGEDYEMDEVYTSSVEYSCPHCYEVLATDEDEAIRILRGE